MLLRVVSSVVVAVLVGVSVAACGDEAAEASLCDSLGDFRAAVSDLRELDDDSSREDLEAARDDVSDAFEQVVTDAGDLAGIRVDGLQSAFGDLGTAIDDLPEGTSIREAIDELEPQLNAVGMAFEALFAGLEC